MQFVYHSEQFIDISPKYQALFSQRKTSPARSSSLHKSPVSGNSQQQLSSKSGNGVYPNQTLQFRPEPQQKKPTPVNNKVLEKSERTYDRYTDWSELEREEWEELLSENDDSIPLDRRRRETIGASGADTSRSNLA